MRVSTYAVTHDGTAETFVSAAETMAELRRLSTDVPVGAA
jgi:hypothetical protein